jgi:hypothetical protein
VSLIVHLDAPAPANVEAPPALAGPLPPAVLRGMYVAALARAEHCPVSIADGRALGMHDRYEPSPSLRAAFDDDRAALVGVLGFGVPLQLDPRGRATWASWAFKWEWS